VFCGILRRSAFFGVFRHFLALGDKFPLRDQNFGGAQTPRPLFWSVENNRAKMGGGSGPYSPRKTFFLVSSWKNQHQNFQEFLTESVGRVHFS